MFLNRNLNISILLSLLWHFFCVSIVSIELVPERRILSGFSDISFLGSILGKEVLIFPQVLDKLEPMVRLRSPWHSSEVEVPIGKSGNKIFSVKKTVSYEDTSHKRKLSAKNFFRDLTLSSNKNQTHTELSKIILESKVVPNFSFGLAKSPMRSYEAGLSLIEGPARSRGIIYKPPLPKLKRWAEKSSQYSNVELKFLVSPEGKVLYVEKILSSGDPEVDLVWMRYMKRWQFLPEQTNRNQWGKVRLNFNEH